VRSDTPSKLRRLEASLEVEKGHTDTGLPYVSVMHPWWEVSACITRSEHGWQMHRGGNGPLYEFATT
jgi:hypothetical protein